MYYFRIIGISGATMSETADVGDDCVKLDLQHGTAVEFTIIFRFVDTFKQTDLLLKLIITFVHQNSYLKKIPLVKLLMSGYLRDEI